ncbi:alpha/beta hydrolase-fold protein [Streptomyces sp. NPDC048506]|uniref:alpha/beta hydrolase n=1 Tax=Streptomyces sp. NPDC048506 TaxID=3155028 RepID=UPI003416F7BE
MPAPVLAPARTREPAPARNREPRRRACLLSAVAAALGLVLFPVLKYGDVFPDTGRPMSFGRPATGLPAVGPHPQFRTTSTLADGTRIGVTTLHGKKSGFTGKVWAWAPPEYYEERYRASAFPVLIALPGGRGYPTNYWMRPDLQLQRAISDLSALGRSKPFVLVMPQLNPDRRHYYDGSDIPGQPKIGTWLSDDVPDLARATFRTFDSRDGWAFMGSSSGGFVGLKQVLQHPDRFRAVIASGPDTRPDSPLWRGHEKERRANDPERLAAHLSARPDAPPVHLQFQIGTEERGRANLERFIRRYAKGPVTADLHVIEGGGHNAKGYVRGMREASLEAISKVLRGPTPSR